jgi:acyl-coenzyme A thioesterase PaaI-like protein
LGLRPAVEGAKDVDRWHGNGVEVIGLVGASFTSYGVDGEHLGWVEAGWVPIDLACNPHGVVQAGIHSLMLDASVDFAINAVLAGRDRTHGTPEMKTEIMRFARKGRTFAVRGEMVRMARQVAYRAVTVRDIESRLVSRATGTFLLHRDAPIS